MYRNLLNTLNNMKIKNKDIAILINKSDSYVSKRTNGSLIFDENIKKDIFKYLRTKGYKGTLSYLFDYSESQNKKRKETNKTIQRLNECIKTEKITNEFLASELNVSTNTISSWRNGKVDKISYENIVKLAKILDVIPSYLTGETPYKKAYIYKDYEESILDERNFNKEFVNLIDAYQRFRGYDTKKIELEQKHKLFLFHDELLSEINNFYDQNFKSYLNISLYEKRRIDYLKAEIKIRKDKLDMFEKLGVRFLPQNYEQYDQLDNGILDLATRNYFNEERNEIEKMELELNQLIQKKTT